MLIRDSLNRMMDYEKKNKMNNIRNLLDRLDAMKERIDSPPKTQHDNKTRDAL